MNLSDAIYMPQLKWKAGECKALATARGVGHGRLVPAFKIPPAGGFDPLERRVLSTVEHIRGFGRRLSNAWGRQLAFIDAELIDDERHSEGLDHHPLTELIERAWLEGGMAGPIVSLRSSEGYKRAVRRYTRANTDWPICLRVTLRDIERIESIETLKDFLKTAGAAPNRTVLLLDGGPLHIDDEEGLAHLLAEHIARMAPPREWLRVFWSATSFPDKPKLIAGADGRYARSDWQLYRAMIKHSEEFSTIPMFSDYGLEFPSQYMPVRVSPTAHLRYSSDNHYFIYKGTTTKKPFGYKAIFPVATRLVEAEEFRGEGYSKGNAYIAGLLKPGATTGNASSWRWASTDHHLSLVLASLASLLKVKPIEERERPLHHQLALI